jgi:glutamate--cysteine ligase catalytic subunit
MGFLYAGSPPLSWEEVQKIKEYIREHGIEQFINLYKANLSTEGHNLRWGEEIEF